MNNITIINIKQLRQEKLCQLIDLAGFRTIIKSRNIELIDKRSTEANKYSDLIFSSIYDAAKAIEPYLKNQYKFVA